MDKLLQEYYENRFEMFSSNGWKEFMEDVQVMHDAYNDLSKVKNAEDFWQTKGYVELLQWLLNLKESSEKTYEELSNEKDVSV